MCQACNPAGAERRVPDGRERTIEAVLRADDQTLDPASSSCNKAVCRFCADNSVALQADAASGAADYSLGFSVRSSTISKECVISAVFSSMVEAEQYFSCESLIARSTRFDFRFLPRTVK